MFKDQGSGLGLFLSTFTFTLIITENIKMKRGIRICVYKNQVTCFYWKVLIAYVSFCFGVKKKPKYFE